MYIKTILEYIIKSILNLSFLFFYFYLYDYIHNFITAQTPQCLHLVFNYGTSIIPLDRTVASKLLDRCQISLFGENFLAVRHTIEQVSWSSERMIAPKIRAGNIAVGGCKSLRAFAIEVYLGLRLTGGTPSRPVATACRRTRQSFPR